MNTNAFLNFFYFSPPPPPPPRCEPMALRLFTIRLVLKKVEFWFQPCTFLPLSGAQMTNVNALHLFLHVPQRLQFKDSTYAVQLFETPNTSVSSSSILFNKRKKRKKENLQHPATKAHTLSPFCDKRTVSCRLPLLKCKMATASLCVIIWCERVFGECVRRKPFPVLTSRTRSHFHKQQCLCHFSKTSEMTVERKGAFDWRGLRLILCQTVMAGGHHPLDFFFFSLQIGPAVPKHSRDSSPSQHSFLDVRW